MKRQLIIAGIFLLFIPGICIAQGQDSTSSANSTISFPLFGSDPSSPLATCTEPETVRGVWDCTPLRSPVTMTYDGYGRILISAWVSGQTTALFPCEL